MAGVAEGPARFGWYELRTTRPEDAAAFYEGVAGVKVRRDGERRLVHLAAGPVGEITALPDALAARGVPAHWQGQIVVDDLEGTVRRFVAGGGERLGPTREGPGVAVATVRDPSGATFALRAGTPEGEPLAWHELHARDHVAAIALYAALFGWHPTTTLELGPPLGAYQRFAWGEGDVGGMVSSAGLPGVHPHWLFFFAVDDARRAADEIRARGGRVVVPPRELPGAVVVHAEDPAGAAFGVLQAG